MYEQKASSFVKKILNKRTQSSWKLHFFLKYTEYLKICIFNFCF